MAKSASAWHTNDEGIDLHCSSPDNCLYGSFETKEEAHQHWENKVAEGKIPKLSKAGNKSSMLVAAAKTATNSDELNPVAREGNIRAVTYLARNSKATPEQLLLARDRFPNNKDFAAELENAVGYPVEELKDEQKLLAKLKEYNEKVTRRDSITDAGADRLLALGAKPAHIIANRNNRLSDEKREQMLKDASLNDYTYYITANKNAAVDVSLLDDDRLKAVILNSSNPDNIDAVLDEAAARKSEKLPMYALYAARNKDTYDETLGKAAALPGISEEAKQYIAWHKNASEDTKAKLGAGESSVKVAKLRALGDAGKVAPLSVQDKGELRTYKFDPKELKEKGLTSAQDVDAYMKGIHGDALFGASYNPKTGEYSGYKN